MVLGAPPPPYLSLWSGSLVGSVKAYLCAVVVVLTTTGRDSFKRGIYLEL